MSRRLTNGHLVLILAALATGCDLPGKPNPADRPVPAEQVSDFNALYATHCAGCHGADGKLGPAPPLNDPTFLAIVPDAELLRVITRGRAVSPAQKSLMPAFGLPKRAPLSPAESRVWAELKEQSHTNPRQQSPVTDSQIEVLAGGIKQRWGTASPTARSIPPYLAAQKLTGGKREGARVFARACAGCHGKEGEGVERDGQLRRKINDPAFLALISDQALRRYAITGRPDLGMPAFDGRDGRAPDFKPLTSAEIDDLVALLASWRLGNSAEGK